MGIVILPVLQMRGPRLSNESPLTVGIYTLLTARSEKVSDVCCPSFA